MCFWFWLLLLLLWLWLWLWFSRWFAKRPCVFSFCLVGAIVSMACRVVIAFAFCCLSSALRTRANGDDPAAVLASAIAEMAGKVALGDGYGAEFLSEFPVGSHSNVGTAFADVIGADAVSTLVLGAPQETIDDAARSLSAAEAADGAKRRNVQDSQAAVWRRMLEAEASATKAIVMTELSAFTPVHGARPLGMQDLRMVAENAVSAADAFVATAKQAPTASSVANDISQADAGTITALKESGVPAALRGASAAGFVQLSGAVAPTVVANLRLVEPSNRVLNAAVAVGNGMSDALAALEDRQRADDAMYRSLVASSGALVRETRGVPT